MTNKFKSKWLIISVRCALLVGYLSFGIQAFSQDPIYSQFYNAPLQLNPAFAGTTYAPKFSLNYRNQWALVPKAYNTFSASYDQYFQEINSGVGVFLTGDSSGDGLYKTIKASGLYSYNLTLQNNYFVKIGIEAAFVQGRWNWDELIFFDQLDPEFGSNTPGGSQIPSSEIRPESTNVNYLDIGTGLLVYSPTFYAGISVKHINRPNDILKETINDVYGGVPMRWSIHAGAQLNMDLGNIAKNAAFISPNVLFVKQGAFKQLNVGAYANFGAFFAGTWLRHTFGNTDAVIFNFGTQTEIFKIGYSYDLTVSQLSLLNTGGSHEIGITINLDRGNRKKVDYNDCFSIFR
jgi:type IX secretion system PorP/SprF family membrane protein